MTASALVKQSDIKRIANVAKQTGQRIEIKVGEAVITVFPESNKGQDSGIDYGRPVL